MKKREIDMINGPLVSSVLKFTFPLMATGILQILYNAADIIVVGQFGGPDSTAVAAIGSTPALINIIVALFVGLSVGTNAALAMSIGRKDDRAAHEIVHTGIGLAVISGFVVLVIGIAFAKQFLQWMLTPAALLDQSTLYMRVYFMGMPGAMVYNFGSAMLRAKGDTKRPLYFLIFTGMVNVIFNIFFVAVCKMDVAGVALATTISQYASAVLVVLALMKYDDSCKLTLKKIRLYKDKVKLILNYGIPTGFTSAMFNIANIFLQSSINSFDNVDINTGATAAASLESFVYTAMASFNQPAITFTAQNLGAKNYQRIHKILRTCMVLGVSFGLVLGVGMYGFGRPLLRLYSPDATSEAIRYGLERMSSIILFYFIDAILEVQMGVMRGMGFSLVPALISIFGICVVRITWIYTIFQKFHEVRVLYMCYPVSWIFTVLMLTVAYMIIKKVTLPKRDIYI